MSEGTAIFLLAVVVFALIGFQHVTGFDLVQVAGIAFLIFFLVVKTQELVAGMKQTSKDHENGTRP